MNDECRFPNLDGLEPPLTAALKATLNEPIPEEAIERVKARARSLAAAAGSPAQARDSRLQGPEAAPLEGGQADMAHHPSLTGRIRRTWMQRPSSHVAAAVVFVLAATGIALWFHATGTEYALADFIKPILEAKSATFKATFHRGDKLVATVNGMWLAPHGERMEIQQPGQPMEITIADTRKGLGVKISPAKKTVVINRVVGIPRDLASLNPLEEMRSLLLNAAKPDVQREPLGEKEVDGRRAVGWRVSGPGLHSPGFTLTIWGDPQTGLPIRVESFSALEGVKGTWSGYAFNVDLDESLFSVEPPAGYTVETVEVDASQPTEKDLIALLRLYSTLMNNAFPKTLDVDHLRRTLGARIHIETAILGNQPPSDECLRKIAEAQTDEEIAKITQAEWYARLERLRRARNAKPDKQREKVDAAASANDGRRQADKAFMARYRSVDWIMMRGLGFVVELPPEADAHYAGKGIRLGAPGTPIFWYRPKGESKYRVVYADLSVREADRPHAEDGETGGRGDAGTGRHGDGETRGRGATARGACRID